MAAPLLIVSRHYAPEPTGSAPVMAELARWLARQPEWSVRVITVRPSYPASAIFDGYRRGERDHAIEDGVDVTRLPTWPVSSRGGLRARVLPEARFLLQLLGRRLLGRLKPCDVVISLCPSILTVVGAAALVRRGGHHVAIVHDIPSGLSAALEPERGAVFSRLLQLLERWSFNRTDRVVVLSEAMQAQLKAIGVKSPIAVLPPHVDTNEIRPSERRQDPETPLLMYSGNLGRKQGLEQLLDLAEELRRRQADARIVIQGEGPAKAALQARIFEDHLTNVTLAPLVPREEIGASLNSAALHLVPQIPGGAEFAVPSKIFSIMAAGRTFVATAEAGSPLAQLGEETDAFICVPPGRPELLADAVHALLSDPDRRHAMESRGRDYVVREVDTEVTMRRFEALLR